MGWKTFLRSPYLTIFLFHHFLDSIETGRKKLEVGIELAFRINVVVGYARYNDWTIAEVT